MILTIIVVIEVLLIRQPLHQLVFVEMALSAQQAFPKEQCIHLQQKIKKEVFVLREIIAQELPLDRNYVIKVCITQILLKLLA